MNSSVDILSLDILELSDFCVGLGQPKFKAKQIFKWLHEKKVFDFDSMSDLSNDFKAKLKQTAYIQKISVRNKLVSKDGTVKFLFEMNDNSFVETVVMTYNHGVSICVSTQVGCRMGCRFCASTKAGFERNLSASEILLQVYQAEKALNTRVSSIVMMGIGEPLDNFDNSVKFYDIITSEIGHNISNRNVSLSTCGLADEIIKLADLEKQLTLSVSLHATSDKRRSELMPINNRFNIAKLLEALRYYYDKTKRRISFEYAVIQDVNDTKEDAAQLRKLLKNFNAHINLIPINKIAGESFSSTRENAERFRTQLEQLGLNATVRRTLGSDIEAACGQLRKDTIKQSGG